DIRGYFGRYVAAADYSDRVLGSDLLREQRGDRGGAGRLDRELRAPVEEAHRRRDLVLADEDALEVATELERQGAETRRVEAVCDRARLEGDRVAGARRGMKRLRELRLDGDHADAVADRGLDAADQAAAADPDDDRVGPGDVLLELERQCPGAREDERVLVRVD